MMKLQIAIALVAAGTSVILAASLDGPVEFGKRPDGTTAGLYTMKNKNGVTARITNYGGIVVSLTAPDRSGKLDDIALGYDSLAGYLQSPNIYFGAIIGRYANRIGGARFTLAGHEYQLEKNNGANTLHGGTRGFDKALWTARKTPDGGLELEYFSKDGEGGYPGNLNTVVTYHLTDANELRIDYAATTDRDTVVNLTNHSYFNLKGAGVGDILGHVVTIPADRFTPVDDGIIPTGELKSVAGTPFDFRKPTAIGARIDHNDEQLRRGKGYDHNWVLGPAKTGLSLAVRVEEPTTGRVMEIFTTEPGVQMYTGNFLDGSKRGKGGKAYGYRSAVAFETQHFPDSPNKPNFPSTVLKAGQQFHSMTVYRLSK